MSEHILKTLPPYFEAIERGEKTFEVRRDDRGFNKGDTVILWLYDPSDLSKQSYVRARKIRAKIGWVLTGGQLGIEAGYVVFSLKGVRAFT